MSNTESLAVGTIVTVEDEDGSLYRWERVEAGMLLLDYHCRDCADDAVFPQDKPFEVVAVPMSALIAAETHFAVQEGRILDARVALSEGLRQLEATREGLRTLPLDPDDNSFRRVQAHVVRQMAGIDDAIKTVVANHGSGAKREAVPLQPGIWIASSGGVLTVTASIDVQDTITDFMAAHQSELDALLAPHGITLNDLARPTYQRVITRIHLTAALKSGEI